MTEKSAVYFQRSKAVHEEFRLIEAATQREVIIGKLQKIIRDVKEKRLEMVDEVILETFQLLNELREVTMRLIYAIKTWQDSFTRPVRPTIYNTDYIIDRMIKHVDFINGSKVRKIFNFQFLRGNPLLLPFPNLKSGDPIKVHSALAKEIRTFANPDEEKVIECYQLLVNCLPPDVYEEKLVSMQKWLIDPWIPRIFATNNTSVPCFPSTKQLVQMTLQKEFGNRVNNDAGKSPSADIARQRSSSASSSSSKASNSSSITSLQGNKRKVLPPLTSLGIRRRLGAQPAAETSLAGKQQPETPQISTSPSTGNKSSAEADKLSPSSSNLPQRMVRRNMMLQKEQKQLVAAVTGDSDLLSINSEKSMDSPDQQEHQDKSSNKNLSDAQLAQMQQLDLYYKELEGMFLPKFGRRAVQTLVAGGERTKDNDDTNEHEFQYRTKRAFSMFTSKAFEKRIDDAEQALRTEDFVRTDGGLIQKRNRILEQRGKADREYKAVGGARLQASNSSRSLGSIPEQAPVGRRARTRSTGDDSAILEEENEDDEGNNGSDDEEENEEEEDDDDDDDDNNPGILSKTPSNMMIKQRSRRGSSVSFAPQIDNFDRVEALRPPKLLITNSNGCTTSSPTRLRTDSQQSSDSRQGSPKYISTTAGSVGGRPRSASHRESVSSGDRVKGKSPTNSQPSVLQKQDSLASSSSSLPSTTNVRLITQQNRSPMAAGTRKGRNNKREKVNTESSDGSKSPLRLSTAEMRRWFVEKSKRDEAAKRQQALAMKMG